MTRGFAFAAARAGAMVFENSRSVIRTFASPWSREKAMMDGSRRVLSVLSTPPVIGTP
jgi:hypothetical protein